jgi:glycosyltransferase 2 family protein
LHEVPVRRKALRLAATLALTGACTAYIVWKIDLGETAHVLGGVKPGYFLLSTGLTTAAVWPMTWRWRELLRVRDVAEPFGWLLRTYFVSYTAAQILPTSLGGDATRIYETSRRHRGQAGPVAGSVLLERALGGAATLALAALGFVLAVGRYPVGPYLWLEGVFVVATAVAAVVLFSRGMRGPLARNVPLLRRLRLERPLRAVYEGLHGYRRHARLVLGLLVLTTFVQVFKILAIWLAGKSVGVDLSPRPYFVMGPMLFLVMLVPFTVNGLAVREAFFISFLTRLGVPSEAAFATGFVFFLIYVGTALPGVVILAWESVRGGGKVVETPP